MLPTLAPAVAASARRVGGAHPVPDQGGGGGEGTLTWFSDWRTATGDSASAISDGGKWNSSAQNPESQFGLVVMANPGDIDFPGAMTNVLRHRYAADNRDGFGRTEVTGLGTIEVGWTRYWRFYWRFTPPDAWPQHTVTSDQYHPVEETGGGNIESAFRPTMFRDTAPWELNWRVTSGADFNCVDMLTKDVTYVFEYSKSRLTSTTFAFHTRILSSPAHAVLYTDEDFENDDVPGQFLDEVASFTHTTLDSMDGWRAGSNGIVGVTEPASDTVSYQGGFAIKDVEAAFSESDWIGGFPHPDEE